MNFRFQRKERNFTLGVVSEAEAIAKAAQVDLLLMRLKQGLIDFPTAWISCPSSSSEAESSQPAIKAEARRETVSPGRLRDRYLKTHEASLEQNTLDTRQTHFNHFAATLGERFLLQELRSPRSRVTSTAGRRRT